MKYDLAAIACAALVVVVLICELIRLFLVMRGLKRATVSSRG